VLDLAAVHRLSVVATVALTLALCAFATSDSTAAVSAHPRLTVSALTGARGPNRLADIDRGLAALSAFTPGEITLASSGEKAFVLGTSPCGKRLCAELWSGTGRLFAERVAPPGKAPIYPGDTGSELVFANSLDGFALDSPWTTNPIAYRTTDGGSSRRQLWPFRHELVVTLGAVPNRNDGRLVLQRRRWPPFQTFLVSDGYE